MRAVPRCRQAAENRHAPAILPPYQVDAAISVELAPHSRDLWLQGAGFPF